jgi:hypothetical protein
MATRERGGIATEQPASEKPVVLPVGYRQSLVTAITVLLGFALFFLRYWSFEAPGHWTLLSVAAALMLLAAILLQIFTLWRSLRIEDAKPAEYRITLRWFFASTLTLLASLVIAGLAASLMPES